jgi:hypothetical protein
MKRMITRRALQLKFKGKRLIGKPANITCGKVEEIGDFSSISPYKLKCQKMIH